MSNKDEEDREKIKFIAENSTRWEELKVWNEAKKYFDWDNTHSVSYSDYLINHTQNLAIDLDDFYQQSKFLTKEGVYMAIDAVPVLTETGEGTCMAFYDGIYADTTEKLAGTWCGDLLQIADYLPEGYQLINCCFAEIWSKAMSCFHKFGANEDDFLLKDATGNLFESASLDFFGNRFPLEYIKVTVVEDRIKFTTIKKSKVKQTDSSDKPG